jgi:hypothetical protein
MPRLSGLDVVRGDHETRVTSLPFLWSGGAAMIGASVPLQFAADADLSRAVWHFNAAIAR